MNEVEFLSQYRVQDIVQDMMRETACDCLATMASSNERARFQTLARLVTWIGEMRQPSMVDFQPEPDLCECYGAA